MNHSHEIIPGIGLGELHFGISKEMVVDTYGEPNEKELPDEMSNMEYWHYDEKDLSLAFDLDNNEQLISIAISSEKYIMEGTSLVECLWLMSLLSYMNWVMKNWKPMKY